MYAADFLLRHREDMLELRSAVRTTAHLRAGLSPELGDDADSRDACWRATEGRLPALRRPDAWTVTMSPGSGAPGAGEPRLLREMGPRDLGVT